MDMYLEYILEKKKNKNLYYGNILNIIKKK